MRIVAFAVLALLVAPVHADDWHKVESSGGFEILFPKAPKETTQTNDSGTISLTQYWLQDGNTMWMATWNDGPDAATATPDEVLDNMRDGTLQKLPSAKLISEKKLTMNGHPGRELTIGAAKEPNMIAVARLYLVDKKRLFTAMVVNDKKAGAADRKRFLDSFKLVAAEKGGMDREVIRKAIKRNLGQIRHCYEKALTDKPTLAGTVTVRFTIGTAGKVTVATGSGLDAKVDTCVADVVKAIKFPAPPEGKPVDVAYPFAFRPD